MCASVRQCLKGPSSLDICGVQPHRKIPNRRCWVPNCKNSNFAEAVYTRLYGFPREAARCREWLKAVGDPNLAKLEIRHLSKFRHICRDHFLSSKITTWGRPTSDAVPTIFSDIRPPLSDECLKEFDERSKNIDESVGEVNELGKNVFEHQYAKPPNVDRLLLCMPVSEKVLGKSLRVRSLHTMLKNTDSQQNVGEDVSSSGGHTKFILPRITQVKSLAKIILPTVGDTYNVSAVINTEKPTCDDITPASAIDSSRDNSSQKEKGVPANNVSVIRASPQKAPVQYVQQKLQQNSLNVRSVPPATVSAPQATCKVNTLQEKSKVTTNNGFQQTLRDDVSSNVCTPSLTKPTFILLPHSQGGAKLKSRLLLNKMCNTNTPMEIEEVPATPAPQQIVCETVGSSVCTLQRKRRKSALVPRRYDEILPTYTASVTIVPPPEETCQMPLQHKTQNTPTSNADSPAKATRQRPMEASKVNSVLEVAIVAEDAVANHGEAPVSSLEEINPKDNMQEDSPTRSPDTLCLARLNSGETKCYGSGRKRKAEEGKCLNQPKDVSAQGVLTTPVKASETSCLAVTVEDVHQMKETVTQVESTQTKAKGTSQKKVKRNVQPLTRWGATNLAVKGKYRRERAIGKQKSNISFFKESIWRTINVALENVSNKKQKQDEEAMEKRWNQLEDRVNQLIEEKVEKTVNQVIEYQLEKRVNEMIEKKLERETVQDPMEKRIGKILEAKMEKIEQRVVEVVDKKMDLVLQCVRSLTDCKNRTKL